MSSNTKVSISLHSGQAERVDAATGKPVSSGQGEGSKPGDGRTSPFGNHKGATAKGPSAGGEYQQNLQGKQQPDPAPQNYWKDPIPPEGDPSTQPRNFAAENRAQTPGSPAQRVNPTSVPTGGVVPPTTTRQPVGTGSPGARMPFKNMR
jgi:hypothetical protein